jgi:hypothetical protein
MDLSQTKLTKEEWNILEIPIIGREFEIIKMIHKSGKNIDTTIKNTKTLINFIKIESNIEKFHIYLYVKYFKDILKKINKKNKYFEYNLKVEKKGKSFDLKKADQIRLNNFNKRIKEKKGEIFEYLLIDVLEKLFNSKDVSTYVYILNYLIHMKYTHMNVYVLNYVKNLIEYFKQNIKMIKYLKNYSNIMKYLKKYNSLKSIKLFSHQKRIITTCTREGSKLVLYQAPTGTGKTLTPLALVKKKRIIFVCAAKHIGMQLAKCCISLQIPIAIAFGCKDPSDIRLHYFAAKEKVRNRITGGIFRVDNSVGDLVEIIISDIQSYLPAMYYMCAFNKKEDLIWYWDEPTISLDKESHSFHSILQNNWNRNIIPNVILSSATLPKEEELTKFIMGYNNKFPNMRVYNIVSSDYEKTIPIINSDGYALLPHNVFDSYDDIKSCVEHIENYKTLLRHFDINKIIEFVLYLCKKKLIKEVYNIENYFESLDDLNTNNIKIYYLFVLKKLKKKYSDVYDHFNVNKEKIFKSCIKITTNDAGTLTDGPTIFLANDVKKLAMFYLKVSKISNSVLNSIFKNINKNTIIMKEINTLIDDENQRLEKLGSQVHDKNHGNNVNSTEFKLQKIYNKKLQFLEDQLIKIELPPVYIPNKIEHQTKWNNIIKNSYTSNIDEEIVEDIMKLDIDSEWKILLMMGIGVFCENRTLNDESVELTKQKLDDYKKYNQIMKKLAQDQKLYLIIASSDYIYGTNYQFCHGYISKDLGHISQEKMIQAFGRVGRSNLQKTYTVRVRNNDLIRKLFLEEKNKPEVINMNKLFV